MARIVASYSFGEADCLKNVFSETNGGHNYFGAALATDGGVSCLPGGGIASGSDFSSPRSESNVSDALNSFYSGDYSVEIWLKQSQISNTDGAIFALEPIEDTGIARLCEYSMRLYQGYDEGGK